MIDGRMKIQPSTYCEVACALCLIACAYMRSRAARETLLAVSHINVGAIDIVIWCACALWVAGVYLSVRARWATVTTVIVAIFNLGLLLFLPVLHQAFLSQ